jgi:protein TonB
MGTKINPEANLRLRYKKVIQFALAFSLLLCIVVFQAFKRFDHSKETGEIKLDKIVAEEIPQTIQEKQPPPPSRPAIPIESESENIPDNVTIEDTNIKFGELPEPPSEPVVEQEDEFIFVAYDDPPKPVGGFEAIHKNLVYPELARKAGIEGTVVVQAKISDKGDVIDTRIVVPLGNSGCNEAAVAAIKAVKWEPAKQRDKPVTVWISIPIRFTLK